MAADPAPGSGGEGPKQPYPWRKTLLTVGGTIAYLIPLFWLWHDTGWPESFGIRITDHGRAGLIENWYYSYLFLTGPNFIDLVAFLYMWAPVAGFLIWLGSAFYPDRRGDNGDQDMPS